MALVQVITVSDRAHRGEYADRSGPLARELMQAAGYDCADVAVVPDGVESVQEAVIHALEAGARIVITTGGTGVGARDWTVEALEPLIELPMPAVSMQIALNGASKTPFSLLTRGIAGVTKRGVGQAFIVSLPGSTGGVRDGVRVIAPIARHVLDQLDGLDHA
ncbi:MogA/MoaB family molybdenum cofactor biosynthesis protein [Gleimia hominis]|uniref:MogA/MoaB family molybdenum cofactor biosynthesis protein n=1 Tax=Gleimia hominis TaxID=595468 RepID=UPI000C808525|nr:MogA/MoaB family molybdenum cofactor biosynthesis protein [Gleimia hominis]WIK64794.1 MogA/MoaB family molybdenum cofactor biosynthesis protein [Gleimia hominis]